MGGEQPTEIDELGWREIGREKRQLAHLRPLLTDRQGSPTCARHPPPNRVQPPDRGSEAVRLAGRELTKGGVHCLIKGDQWFEG